MPTPYGSRGGLAFGAEELRVLRRALALALLSRPVSAEDVQDVQDCLRLADSLDEATRESARLRAFLVADLARYRAALPGTAAGYLALLDETLDAGHRPTRDDLAALRALSGNPAAAALLRRCRAQAAPELRTVPAARTRLTALPGGLPGGPVAAGGEPARRPDRRPDRRPAAPQPEPKRPIPTPGEVFPRRRPTPPPGAPGQHLAAG
ncbi:hypothetical protein [Streptomyces sp. CRN 30]|uniref:hypothetical protein n=1 Tax=Streptomyces sp. CRN 30 TaxID=3075613 RepID=UPI002A7F55CA|nr:hypothetical protein [Streptomyces sp. CRN 30]